MAFALQLLVLLAVILIGMRFGGVALGILGGAGTFIFVFLFGMKPGSPPTDVIYIILSVVLASAVLEATGGLEYLIQVVEKFLRKHPKRITILAPLCTCTLTMLVGTGHAVYSLFPIIYDIAYKMGIRPERPMAAASVASQMGIVGSPIAAAITGFIAMTANTPNPPSLPTILMITVPATYLGVFLLIVWSYNRGRDLDKDPLFLEKMKDPEFSKYVSVEATTLNSKIGKRAKTGVILFFLSILTIVILALFKFTPVYDGKHMSGGLVVQLIMLAGGSITLLVTKVKPVNVASGAVFKAGMIAIACIFGITWMTDTLVQFHKQDLITTVGNYVKIAPWSFAIATAIMSILLYSQGATLAIMIPIGLSLNIPVPLLIGMIPACYAYFFFALYPSDLACMNFDRTGTTRVGKYLLNHSFMMPGLIGVSGATIIGYLLAKVILM